MRRKFAQSILLIAVLISAIYPIAQIPTVESANFVGQTIYLKADGSIEPSNAPIDVHGNTYTLTGDIQCPPAGYCISIERSDVLLDGDGYTIEGWPSENGQSGAGYAIYAGFLSNIEIRNITIKGCANGIEVQSVSGVNIHNTTIDGKTAREGSEPVGLDVMYCDGATIDQNSFLNNYMGILVQSSNCTITNNQIMYNTGGGVTLSGSGNSLKSNLIAKNDLGIQIQSSGNLLQDNDIVNNKRIGILIGASNNIFIGNNIVGQNSSAAYGVQMGPYESGNTFYHNDFENNYVHVEGGDYAPIVNVWDNSYPAGGNYWDTYEGVDNYRGLHQNETGSDGIGDASYQITIANVDHYPMLQPLRSNPDISEEITVQTDYTMIIVLLTIVVVCVIIGLIVFYWKRQKKESSKEMASVQQNVLVGKSIVPILLTLSFIIILNFAFITADIYQIGSVELYGGALYFDEIIISLLSSIVGLFLTWKIVIKQRYSSGKTRQILSAVLVAFLFVIYLIAYSAYRQFEMFGLLQYLQPTIVMAWTFATTLIGCYLGFWLGGTVLKRLHHHSTFAGPSEKHSAFSYSCLANWFILIFAGFISGYAAGYISWFALGQAQLALGASFSYASVHPPSIMCLLGWAVGGAVVIPLGILLKRHSRMRYKSRSSTYDY